MKFRIGLDFDEEKDVILQMDGTLTKKEEFCCEDMYENFDPEERSYIGSFEVAPIEDIPRKIELCLVQTLRKTKPHKGSQETEETHEILEIKFCPFCGQKVEIEKVENVIPQTTKTDF